MFNIKDASESVSGVITALFANFMLLLAVFLVFAPLNPIKAAENLAVFRSYQYDLQSTKYGSSSSALSCEVVTQSFSRQYARKCLIIKLKDVTMDAIRNAVHLNTGGVVILVPEISSLNPIVSQGLYDLERSLLSQNFEIPIYFAKETLNSDQSYYEIQEITSNFETAPIHQTIWNSIWASGHRMTVNALQPTVSKYDKMVNIESRLEGNPGSKTILIVAYMDSFGAVPGLSYGYDSNASGATLLIILSRIFGKLYSKPETRGNYNLVFLLSNGGKFNFLGSEKWLKANLKDSSNSALIDSIEQVICLEGLSHDFESTLRMHLSRVPKPDSFSQRLLDALRSASKVHQLARHVNYVHKKVVLSKDWLAWEHERYSIHRLPALTLSTWPSSSEFKYRRSMLDLQTTAGANIVAKNGLLIAEGLARLVFNRSDLDPIVDTKWSTEEIAQPILDLLVKNSRSSNFLSVDTEKTLTDSSVKLGPGQKEAVELLRILHKQFVHNGNKQTKYLLFPWHDQTKAVDDFDESNKLNQLAPVLDVSFYSEQGLNTLTLYKLKSSVFDLFIGLCVMAYLSFIYFSSERFEDFFSALYSRMKPSIVSPGKMKTH